MALKIGDLARRAGLTVRTLHHYDKIGLMREMREAMGRGAAFEQPQVQELAWRWMRQFQILIGNDPELAQRLTDLQAEIPAAQHLFGVTPEMIQFVKTAFAHKRCSLIAPHLLPGEAPTVLQRQLRHRDAWWPLVIRVRAAMQQGLAPDSPEAQALAQAWRQLFRLSYCGDDGGLESRVLDALRKEPDLSFGIGIDAAFHEFIQTAMMHLHLSQHRKGGEARPVQGSVAKPSAWMVAQQRAVHQWLDVPVVFEDALAGRIVGDEGQHSATFDPARFNDPMSRGLRASLVARSQETLLQWQAALARGVRQFVVLGAGLDTLAYRPALLPADARVFEVDLPAMQRWKRKRLKAAGLSEPPQLRFVPVDFHETSLTDGLARAGFDAQQVTFVSWLGVVMYLELSAIQSTLAVLGRLPAGSSVIFDYALPAECLAPMERVGRNVMMQRLAQVGEPWKTLLAPETAASLLQQAGFKRLEDWGAEEINARFFANRTDGLCMGGGGRLMKAWT